jgi:hypothetical protein
MQPGDHASVSNSVLSALQTSVGAKAASEAAKDA